MIASVLIFIIRGLRPLLGPTFCKFPVSCTQYAAEQLKTKSFFTACVNIVKRLLACSPLF